MSYTIIPIESWKRKSTFAFFNTYDNPFFNITANVDVTALVKSCRTTKHSFFLSSLFASQKTIDRIENLRMRLVDDEVRLYRSTQAGSTILLDDETFGFCYFPVAERYLEFLKEGAEAVARFKANPDFEARNGDFNMIYYSIIPWVSFTSFQHAYRSEKNDSVPRIVFGKYFEQNHRYLMPVSVEVHHALVDGIHVGRYFSILEEETERIATLS